MPWWVRNRPESPNNANRKALKAADTGLQSHDRAFR